MKSTVNPGTVRSRPTWLAGAAGALLLLPLTLPVAAGDDCTTSTCPNIVFIMFDDLGLPNLTPYPSTSSNPGMLTPNIQALANVGVRFDQYYASPVCSPTRVSLLTGQYQQGFNIRKQLRFDYTYRGIPGAVTTLPEMLKARGYQTGHFGKWHVGFNKPEFRPQAMGFDTMYMLSDTLSPAGLKHCDPAILTSDTSTPEVADGYTTDLLFDEAENFVTAAATENQPFFANIWLYAPHAQYRDDGTCIPPSTYFDSCALVPQNNTQGEKDFCALVAHADDRIGQLRDLIESLELPGETIVIVASDNGDLENLSTGEANFPLRAGKGKLFEGGIRVPFIAWKTSDSGPARTYEPPTASFELYPTLAELAGASLSGLTFDGQSFAPAILETTDPARAANFVFENNLSNENLDYIGTGYDADRRWLDYAVRRRDSSGNHWKLLFQHFINGTTVTDQTYLFRLDDLTHNYEDDSDNMASANAAKVASLKQDYLDWRRRETLLPFNYSHLVSDIPGVIEVEGRDVFFSNAAMVRMAANTLYDFHDGDFGFSAWIKPATPPSGGNDNRIIAQKPGSWVLTWNRTTAKVKLFIEEHGSTGNVTLESTTTAPVGQWTPVSFSIFGWRLSDASIRLYVGADHPSSPVELDAGIYGVDFVESNRVQIGTGYAGDGTVDEDRAFHGAMRDVEMAVASWLPEEVDRIGNALMRYEDFEGTLGAWETTVVDAGASLNTTTAAGMTQTKGLEAIAPAGTRAYLSESDLDDDAVTDNETRLRVSFQFNPDNLGMPNNTELRIFAGRQGTPTPTANPLTIDLRKTSTGYEVQGRVLLDAGGTVNTSWFPVSGQTHIDFEWRAADAGFDEGSFSLSLNYVLKQELKAIDNGTRVINRVVLGPITAMPAGSSPGKLWIDHFESYR